MTAEENQKKLDERMGELRKASLEMQNVYAKWVIASLLLIHGATMGYLIANVALFGSALPWAPLLSAAGLLLALLSGASAWWNYGLLWQGAMSMPYKGIDKDSVSFKRAKLALRIAVGCAVASAIAFFLVVIIASCSVQIPVASL